MKKIRLLIPVILSACLLTACDPKSHSESYVADGMTANSAAGGYTDYAMTKMEANDSFETSEISADTLTENEITTSRKLIRTVSLSFSIPKSDTLADSVNSISQEAEKLGGYVENNNSTYGDYASGNLSVKIPTAKADAFIETLKGSGMTLKNYTDSTEDVTLQYVDVESRLKVKEEMKKKYEEYLQSATTMEDIMSIERELSSVISDIESYQSQLNVLKSQVEYTTVHIGITCEVSSEAETFPEEFMRILKNLGGEVGGTFIDAFCWFVNTLITLLFAIPLLVLVIRAIMFAIGKTWKRKKKKPEAKKESTIEAEQEHN